MVPRKLQFMALTLGLSFAVVTAMVAAGSSSDRATAPAAMSSAVAAPQEKPSTSRVSEPRDVPESRPEAVVVVPSFADIAEKANPAVVNITATEIIRPGDRRRPEGGGPFEFFFPNPHGRPDDDGGPNDDPERQDHGGSGFIISDDGLILTNHHVIEDADRVTVRLLGDSREYPAQKIGSDPDTDLALLKISTDTKRMPTIPLGDSNALRVGDWVLAIGNPLAYEHTVTVGVVSAKGRKLYAMNRDASLDNFIQTDAAINRGNSGGPLLNARGEAIGINSAISVAGQGISFAIPINMAKDVMTQLLSKGKVTRGFLGVEIRDIERDLDPEKREYFKISDRKGAFIENVNPGLPADNAGLRKGDAIVSVDGKALASSDDLIRVISAKAPGEKVSLGVVRDGKEQKIVAELADRTVRASATRGSGDDEGDTPGKGPASHVDKSLGFVVHDMSSELRREYRLRAETEGVVVVHVSPDGQAWEKGIREGDVIVEVNRTPVGDLDAYGAATKSLKRGDLVNLYVVGPGASRYVTLRVEGD